MPMTEQQIQDLTNAFDAAVADPNKDNIAAYYTVLENAGFFYGELAKGVVFDDTFSGIFANNFAQNKIEGDKGGAFTGQPEQSLNLELMVADFDARQQAGFDGLIGQTISDYHDDAFNEVFQNVANPEEAWTPYAIVRALDDFEIWRTDSAADYFKIYANMFGAYFDGDLNANSWLQDVKSGVIFNLETKELELGDRVGLSSLNEYLNSDGRGDLSITVTVY